MFSPTLFGLALALCGAASGTQILTALPASATEFDYVIVGAGVAGLVLGNRLTSTNGRHFKVLVIEAGGDPRGQPLIENPNNYIQLTTTGLFNWNWPTEQQRVGGLAHNISGGKTLGGSSSINGMDWTRGSKEQYDAIAALGNPGWGWMSLQKYMKKAECFNRPTAIEASRGATYDPDAQGFHGLVGTGWSTPYQPYKFFQYFVGACAQVFGIATQKDLCGGDPNSATQTSLSVHRPPNETFAVRSSSAVSYLFPTLGRSTNPGLTVLINTRATRITWKVSSAGPAVASGVEFGTETAPDVRRRVTAKKEVIVSAGAIMSPHFLKNSGIGDPRELAAVGVAPVVNSPGVGTGLQDQALNLFLYTYSPAASLDPDIANALGGPGGGALAFPSLKQLAIVDRGAWTSVDGLERVFRAQADLIGGSTPVAEFSSLDVGTSLVGGSTWGLLPQTRGTVKLASSDPFAYPLIDPAYLDDPFDLFIQSTCVRAFRALFKTAGLAGVVGTEVTPGALLPPNATDAQNEVYTKASYMPVYHPVGSVAMMPQKMGGSVGPNLVLYGTKNVRVVDASIIPFQLSAHLSSTVYGIAEKASDMILDDA